MDEYIEKHLYDVLLSIEETESYFEGSPSVYQDFEKISSAKELWSVTSRSWARP